MTRRRTVGALACLATVPVLLAGCSSAQQASQTLPTTPPAAASATASPTLPPLGPADFPEPAAARQKTPDGVKAFTDYYVQLMNRQLVSLDSTPLRDLSQNCETCNALANSYDQAKAAHQTYDGGAITITGTGSAGVDGDSGDTSFVLEQAPIVLRDQAGQAVPGRSFSASTRYTGGCRLMWDAHRSTWLMVQLDVDRL